MNPRKRPLMLRAIRLVVFCVPVLSVLGFAQTNSVQPQLQQPAALAPSQTFDINAAVNAYLAKMPAAQRARSDAYFEGGYWLLLWDFLSTVAAMWIFLHFRWSARMRDWAESVTRFK